MRYVVLLYGDERTMPEPDTPEWDADLAGYAAFDELAGDAIVAGEALRENAVCLTVRHGEGEVRVTAGPYAETVECLGGIYVLEAATLDDAVELARNIPAALYGGVEVRPMVEWIDRGGVPLAEGEQRYLATIHGPETEAETPGTPGWEAGATAHGRFGEEAGAALQAAGAIHPTTAATTVRVRDGELLLTDGPYAESMEVVGGFYLLRGPEEKILELAALMPVPDGGAVELRPVLELDG